MTRNIQLILPLLFCIWIVPSHELAVASGKPQSMFRYDRVEILERFLRDVYPDLATTLAMLEVDATLEPNGGMTVRGLKFYPCRSGASVSVPTIGGIIPLGPERETQSPSPEPPIPPRCGEDPPAESRHFLHVSVDVSAGHRKRPISKFAASGTYVDTKLQNLREGFAGKWYPTHDEVLQALRSKNPKYGPDNKQAFLETLPLENIHRLTGCRLHPETATFVAELKDNSLHLPPDLQWHLSGTAAGSRADGTCSAAFEPFGGRLTLFMD